MTINLKISQDIDARVDWGKLAKDLKEKFNINESEKDIETFCCKNELKYLAMESYEPQIEETYTSDLTEDTS